MQAILNSHTVFLLFRTCQIFYCAQSGVQFLGNVRHLLYTDVGRDQNRRTRLKSDSRAQKTWTINIKHWKCTNFVRAFQVPKDGKEGKSNEERGRLTTEMAGREVSGSCCPTSPLLSPTLSSSSSSSSLSLSRSSSSSLSISSLSLLSSLCFYTLCCSVQYLLSCHGHPQ